MFWLTLGVPWLTFPMVPFEPSVPYEVFCLLGERHALDVLSVFIQTGASFIQTGLHITIGKGGAPRCPSSFLLALLMRSSASSARESASFS